MIKFIVMSDIHNEFKQYFIEKLDEKEEEIYLILAGDIGLFERDDTFKPFIIDCSIRFKHVIWIAGNHEYYHGNFHTSFNDAVNYTKKLDNVSLLEKDVYTIDDEKVVFICTTLWSDLDNDNPLTMERASRFMADYTYIRSYAYDENGNHDNYVWGAKLRPTETYLAHLKNKKWIFDEVKKYNELGYKIVVVTHHAPSRKSISIDYKTDMLNGAYVSELSEEIYDSGINYWIHGHTHNSHDYMIDETRVICNPRGYHGEINKEFRYDNILEI